MKQLTTKIVFALTALVAMVTRAMGAPAPVPTFDLTKSVALSGAEWDFAAMFPYVFSIYYDPMGRGGNLVVYGAIVITMLVGLALRQESITIPLILLGIFGQVLYWGQLFPVGWGHWVIVLIYIIPAGGIIYTLYTTKRKG